MSNQYCRTCRSKDDNSSKLQNDLSTTRCPPGRGWKNEVHSSIKDRNFSMFMVSRGHQQFNPRYCARHEYFARHKYRANKKNRNWTSLYSTWYIIYENRVCVHLLKQHKMSKHGVYKSLAIVLKIETGREMHLSVLSREKKAVALKQQHEVRETETDTLTVIALSEGDRCVGERHEDSET